MQMSSPVFTEDYSDIFLHKTALTIYNGYPLHWLYEYLLNAAEKASEDRGHRFSPESRKLTPLSRLTTQAISSCPVESAVI